MSHPEPNAPPEPSAARSSGWGDLRARLTWWLRQLTGIGAGLGNAVNNRARAPAAAGGVQLRLAWALVARAMQWTRALEARLAAEARQATRKPLGALGRLTRLAARADRDREMDDWDADPEAARWPKTAPERKPAPYHCIRGQTDAQVVMQICADLHEAAMLLGEDAPARRIEEIFDAASRVLCPRLAEPAAPQDTTQPAGDASTPSAAMDTRPPDTG
jgi:hypothetical protein